MTQQQFSMDFTLTPQQAETVDAWMARPLDPWTSHAAGRRAKTHASVGRLLVLKALTMRGPLNDFELATVTGWQQTSIGKRRLECQRAGWVRGYFAAEREQISRKSPSGVASLVWEITTAGAELLSGSFCEGSQDT